MTSDHYSYNNTICLTFYRDDTDRELLKIVMDALDGKAREALNADDYETTLKFLKRLQAIKDHIKEQDSYVEEEKNE